LGGLRLRYLRLRYPSVYSQQAAACERWGLKREVEAGEEDLEDVPVSL
jgi:hypothetical protein